MQNRLFLLLFFCINIFAVEKKTDIPVLAIDSSYYYAETALRFKNLKVYEKALENANKSIDFAKKNLNNASMANGYYTLGLIYLDLEKYDNAIEKFIRSISVYNTIEPSTKLALSYYNLGICYIQKNNYERAESYFNKANSVYDNIDLSSAKDMVNLQKAVFYLEKNQIQKAESALQGIINQKTTDYKLSDKILSEVNYQLGNVKFREKKHNEAIDFLNKAYDFSKKDLNLDLQIKTTRLLSKVYDEMALTNNSLAFLKIHIKLKDSLDKINSKKNQNIISQQVNIDDLMRSMEKLDKDKKEQEKAGKFSKLINILSIALITILSLLSLSLYKNNIIRNKSNELLKEKNNELEEAKARIEKASQARADFLSTVSHELRTPLNAINGISHILLEEEPKESQVEYLKSLKFSGNYLLTYINEILEINRIESDNIELEHISFNFRELLNNIYNTLKELAGQNNNNFKIIIDPEIPQNLIGDPTKLSQVVINLINNALKFTNKGEVIMIANLVKNENNKCKIHFEINDTGIGIPENKQEEIFESFSQGSVEINRKYGGTGLGLTIVKKLVSLMGGEIKVESKVNLGSKFYFDLEFEGCTSQTNLFEEKELDDKVFISKKVLLVEDNKINQMITKKMLEKKQMDVAICETGEDAIDMVRNFKYDLVLMDVHLPGINGTHATEEIRKFNDYTPIIALTAISLNENREMLMSYGMTDVITKPFNPDNFYKIIETNLLAAN